MSKAQRTVIQLGALEIEGFMLPDGSYRMSLTQVATIIGLAARNAFDFLESKAFKSLVGEGYTVSISEIDVDEQRSRGGSRIRALPLDVAVTYWIWQCYRGNKQALNLMVALGTEGLERRFDAAFGVTRTESEYNDRLTARVQELESTVRELNDGWATTEITREEIRILREYIRDHGLPGPFELENQDAD